jgi:hypothetical protein
MDIFRIGIDPGVNTGIAVKLNGVYLSIETTMIHKAMKTVAAIKDTCDAGGHKLTVVIENPNASGGSIVKAQGAGSIKRDFSVWRDFLTDIGVEFRAIKPMKGMTKVDEHKFQVMTKWMGRTSNHARDAAMLIL